MEVLASELTNLAVEELATLREIALWASARHAVVKAAAGGIETWMATRSVCPITLSKLSKAAIRHMYLFRL